MLNWKNLEVVDADDQMHFTLGEYLANPANVRDDIELNDDGSMGAWPGFLVYEPGTEPDWDGVLGDVDWSGFAEALNQ